MDTYNSLKSIIFATLLVIIATGTSFAIAHTVVEGTIQGANCIIHDATCPVDATDAHIALEQDFVIITDNGDYFFLPNLSRAMKIKYINQEVRITGDQKGYLFVAAKLDVKTQGKYVVVFDVEKMNAINNISF